MGSLSSEDSEWALTTSKSRGDDVHLWDDIIFDDHGKGDSMEYDTASIAAELAALEAKEKAEFEKFKTDTVKLPLENYSKCPTLIVVKQNEYYTHVEPCWILRSSGETPPPSEPTIFFEGGTAAPAYEFFYQFFDSQEPVRRLVACALAGETAFELNPMDPIQEVSIYVALLQERRNENVVLYC